MKGLTRTGPASCLPQRLHQLSWRLPSHCGCYCKTTCFEGFSTFLEPVTLHRANRHLCVLYDGHAPVTPMRPRHEITKLPSAGLPSLSASMGWYPRARGTLQAFLVPGCLAGSDPQITRARLSGGCHQPTGNPKRNTTSCGETTCKGKCILWDSNPQLQCPQVGSVAITPH